MIVKQVNKNEEIVSQFFDKLRLFLFKSIRNEWIYVDGFKMYVRKSKRLYQNNIINCFDIASMEADIPGSKIFTSILTEFLKRYPNTNIFIESILNPRLFLFLEKYGFKKYPIGEEYQHSMILIQRNIMKKNIILGDIAMFNWKKGDDLFPEWMHKDSEYDDEIRNTLPNEIILPSNQDFTLIIDYPLHIPYKYQFNTGEKGMTREDFVKLCVDSYQFIYAVEDDTTTIKPGLIPGIYNRITTDGKYGIWGHSLDDLVLCSADISDDNSIELGVDS